MNRHSGHVVVILGAVPLLTITACTSATKPEDATVWAGLAKEVVGLVVAVAAGVGLWTWRRQQQKAHDFDVARQVLRAVYVLRDAIRTLRVPISHGTDDEANRWKAVAAAARQFEAAFLEAEVLWSATLHRHRVHLRELMARVQGASEEIRISKTSKLEDLGLTPQDLAYARRVRWGIGSDNDAFWQEVSAVIVAVEDATRPKLRW